MDYGAVIEETPDEWAVNRYLDMPPDQWPQLKFNWDLSAESQRFALDGVELSDFQRRYPEGFHLGWVNLKEFDAKLCRYSRRDGPNELWERGFKGVLASAIVYLAKGLPITPPLVKPLNADEVIFMGGNHRYAAAKATGVESIPLYVEPCNHEAVARIVPVRWGM